MNKKWFSFGAGVGLGFAIGVMLVAYSMAIINAVKKMEPPASSETVSNESLPPEKKAETKEKDSQPKESKTKPIVSKTREAKPIASKPTVPKQRQEPPPTLFASSRKDIVVGRKPANVAAQMANAEKTNEEIVKTQETAAPKPPAEKATDESVKTLKVASQSSEAKNEVTKSEVAEKAAPKSVDALMVAAAEIAKPAPEPTQNPLPQETFNSRRLDRSSISPEPTAGQRSSIAAPIFDESVPASIESKADGSFTISWKPVSEAKKYRVIVRHPSGTRVLTRSTYDTKLTVPPPPGIAGNELLVSVTTLNSSGREGQESERKALVIKRGNQSEVATVTKTSTEEVPVVEAKQEQPNQQAPASQPTQLPPKATKRLSAPAIKTIQVED